MSSVFSLKLENITRTGQTAGVKRRNATSFVEWDEKKNRLNQKKHNVSFEEAASIFADPLEVAIGDPDYAFSEFRLVSIGESFKRRLLVVSYTERANKIRIINARKPTRLERRAYEEA